MKLTAKENYYIDSIAKQHEVLLQATSLLMGREGVLETEKEMYLILSIVNLVANEDVVALCNADNRSLLEIMDSDIEPFFNSILDTNISRRIYEELKFKLFNRCLEIWNNQHSVVGVLDSILTMLSTITPEEKQEALEATAKIAEQAFENRTQRLEKQGAEVNQKLEALIQQYVNKNDVKE